MTKFFNSGLYIESFYKKHQIDFENIYTYEEIKYDYKLLRDYYILNEKADEEDLDEDIEKNFYEDLSFWTVYFEPLIFDKHIALKCDLIPFSYKDINLLALAGSGTDLSPKLDAYQALVDCTIDKHSKLFTEENYFKYIVGEELTFLVKLKIEYSNDN